MWIYVLFSLVSGLVIAGVAWKWHLRRTCRRYSELGSMALDAGLYDVAERHFRHAHQAADRSQTGKTDLQASLTNLAIVHKEKGEFDEALRFGLESAQLQVGQKRLPESLDVVGDILDETGRSGEAIRYREAALEVRRQSCDPHAAEMANSFAQLGFSLQLAGRHMEAAEAFQDAVHVWSQREQSDRPYMAAAILHRGLSLAAMGHFGTAEYSYREALAMQTEDLGPASLEVSNTYNNLGILYSDFGRFDDALEAFRASLEIRLRYFDEQHGAVRRVRANIGQCHRRMRQVEAAAPKVQRRAAAGVPA